MHSPGTTTGPLATRLWEESKIPSLFWEFLDISSSLQPHCLAVVLCNPVGGVRHGGQPLGSCGMTHPQQCKVLV